MSTIIERMERLKRIGRAVKRVIAVVFLLVGVGLLGTWWFSSPRQVGPLVILGALLTLTGVVGVLDPSKIFRPDTSGE